MNYRQYMYSYPHKTAYGPLPDLNITDYLPLLEETSDNSLYFHIPFCEAKCGYCNLFSVAGKNTELMEKYMSVFAK